MKAWLITRKNVDVVWKYPNGVKGSCLFIPKGDGGLPQKIGRVRRRKTWGFKNQGRWIFRLPDLQLGMADIDICCYRQHIEDDGTCKN